ncbi:MAG: Ldh family oxidoreductase [Thaumarchaeota archaeon]|nr:Ldh family oxidoreductase [Nitrososphaerota archaeon]
MRRVKAGVLRKFTASVFEAAGTPEDIAETVSNMLVKANLCGVDSHGVIRITEYIGEMDRGQYKVKERPKIIKEKGGIGIVDGRWGFGQITGIMAMELAMKKAKTHGIGAVIAKRTNHIGRVADYTELAIKNKMIGFGLTNGGVAVAPWQGKDGLLGTNPISYGIPAWRGDPIVMDYATSVSSYGKIDIYRSKGKELPNGWVQDKEGNPSNDPGFFSKGGTILTFGGYKGYGLNLVVESLGGALLGEGVSDEFVGQNGTYMQAIDVEHFIPFAKFGKDIDKLVTKMRKSRPAPGYTEVLVPGDPERRAFAERSKAGIELNDAIWEMTMKTAKRFGVEEPETV